MTESSRVHAGLRPPGRRLRPVGIPAIPAHAAVVLGVATAGYGVALAAVSGLQSGSEADLAATRAPVAAAIDASTVRHDRLGADLDRAIRRYDDVAAGYDAATTGLDALERGLTDLASLTNAVDGQSRALPTRIAIPPVVRSVAAASRPAAHATTGGSAAP